LPRRRNKKIAMVLAGVFIVVLFLELLAIFSPAIGGFLAQHRRVEIVALAPPGALDEATVREVASALGAQYRVVTLDVPATNATTMFYTLIVYEDGEPLVVTVVPRSANATLVANVVSNLLQHAAQLPRNETLLYLGGNELIPVPRNETQIMAFIEALYQQLAAHPPIAGNATAAGG